MRVNIAVITNIILYYVSYYNRFIRNIRDIDISSFLPLLVTIIL